MEPAKEAKMMFKMMDLDGNGSLDPVEFASRLSDLGLGDLEIQQLFIQMDADNDGKISAEEFNAGFVKYKQLEHKSQTTLAALPSLAASGQRKAEQYMEMKYESEMELEDELEAIMAAGDTNAKQDAEVKAAFDGVDADGSGTVSAAPSFPDSSVKTAR